VAQDITIDVTKCQGLDPQTIGVTRSLPDRRASAPGVETVLRAATFLPNGKFARDLLSLSTSGAHVITKGTFAAAPRGPVLPDFTVAVGPSLSATAFVAGGGINGGIYYWGQPAGHEWGWYGGMAAGFGIGVGVSVAGQVTFLLGPAPSYLMGPCMVVGADWSVTWPIKTASLGGFLVFSAPPRPINFYGVGVQFGVGLGVSNPIPFLPSDLYLERTYTFGGAL
jgi:hypothetical protein